MSKNNTKRMRCLLLCLAMLSVALMGCGGNAGGSGGAPAQEPAQNTQETADEGPDVQETEDATAAVPVYEREGLSREFTYLLDQGVEPGLLSDYNDAPAIQYWLDMSWDPDNDGSEVKIDVEFSIPPTGGETDYVTTLIATGAYPDVMSLNYSTEKARSLYEQGIAMDLTDLVDRYMPNYKAWMDEHSLYAEQMYSTIDGEKKLLQLSKLYDQVPDPWGGFLYRRDWIVAYGTDENGKSFTGGWGDDGVWTDDVVFPSGNPYPVYISDWEWMLQIFEDAMADLGITDGAAMTLYYPGAVSTGEIVTGFGGGNYTFYIGQDSMAHFGGNSDNFRAYIECMTAWYANGWIDSDFEERSSEMFFKIDPAATFSGKVGLWYGVKAQAGNGMDTGEEFNTGICVMGAPQPINDVYGSPATQNKLPDTFYGTQPVGHSYIVTTAAEGKDIPALLTAIDYLYSDEGGRLRTFGFSDELQNVLQNEKYKAWGLEDGAYTIETDEDGKRVLVENPKVGEVDDLTQAASMRRVPGLEVNKGVDHNYSAELKDAVEMWRYYENTGTISELVISQLTQEQASDGSMISSSLDSYTSQAVPDFITGRRELNDETWAEFCKAQEAFGPERYVNNLNEIIGTAR